MSIFDILSGRKSFTKTPRTKLTGIGLIDVFTGAMPILKQPSRAALNTIEAELTHFLQSPFKQEIIRSIEPLKGSFDTLVAARDAELGLRGGDLQNIKQLIIPVQNTGEIKVRRRGLQPGYQMN